MTIVTKATNVESIVDEQRRLDGKAAVITGGSSGIGLAAAQLFAQHGARLLLAGQEQDKLDDAAAGLSGAVTVAADLSAMPGIAAVVQAARDSYGQIDVLFANAGIAHAPDLREVDETAFDRFIAVNVKSVFFTVQQSLDLLADGASVILTSSAAHSRGSLGDPLYTLTKAAVASMARTFAADPGLLARRIRVNSLSPGSIRTPLTTFTDPATAAAMDDYITATVPMRRIGTAGEAARAALFLASSDSAYTTGADLPVDGGLAQI